MTPTWADSINAIWTVSYSRKPGVAVPITSPGCWPIRIATACCLMPLGQAQGRAERERTAAGGRAVQDRSLAAPRWRSGGGHATEPARLAFRFGRRHWACLCNLLHFKRPLPCLGAVKLTFPRIRMPNYRFFDVSQKASSVYVRNSRL